MALINSKIDRDFAKFRDAGNSKTKIAVTSEEDAQSLRFEQVSSTLMYLGEGLLGALTSEAKWKIKKIDTTTGVVITVASSDFDQIWDNRGSLTYV